MATPIVLKRQISGRNQLFVCLYSNRCSGTDFSLFLNSKKKASGLKDTINVKISMYTFDCLRMYSLAQ